MSSDEGDWKVAAESHDTAHPKTEQRSKTKETAQTGETVSTTRLVPLSEGTSEKRPGKLVSFISQGLQACSVGCFWSELQKLTSAGDICALRLFHILLSAILVLLIENRMLDFLMLLTVNFLFLLFYWVIFSLHSAGLL